MKELYKMSGKSGGIYWITATVGILFTTITSMFYSTFLINSTELVLSFACYALYLGIILLLNLSITHFAKCRSAKSAQIAFSLLSIYTLYISWVTYVGNVLQYSEIQYETSSLLFDPFLLSNYISICSKSVYDTIFGIQITGWILWVIWTIEALSILALGYFSGKITTFEKVFCENCKKWAKIDIQLMFKYDSEEELARILDSDFSEIVNLKRTDDFTDQHILVNIRKCPKCENLLTINIDKQNGFLYYRTGEPRSAKYSHITDTYLLDHNTYSMFQKLEQQDLPVNN